VEPEYITVARQRLGKLVAAATNTHTTRSVGCGVSYAVRAEANLQFVVKENQVINFSQNFLFMLKANDSMDLNGSDV
jgi:hypothetical protein